MTPNLSFHRHQPKPVIQPHEQLGNEKGATPNREHHLMRVIQPHGHLGATYEAPNH